ncbi:MAG TPA: NmrA family NAD(P)-binding protein [Drouetiella sp.]
MSNILVTGATGKTGSYTIPLLLEKGHHVRALVRQIDARSKELEKLGVEIAVGDYLDFDSVVSALRGINRAYFCYPIRVGIIQATGYFAQAARENGVEAIVNMSQISSRREAKSNAARDHFIAEQVFDWSGVPTTHLKPTFFAEWLLNQSSNIASGKLILPYKGKHAPIAAEDQAHVIANILDKPEGHGGKVYPLYGPENLTMNEVAEELTEALGHSVSYQYVPFDAFYNGLRDRMSDKGEHNQTNLYGALENSPQGRVAFDFLGQHLREVSEDHDNGVFAGTNDVVQKIGGIPGTTVKAYALKHKDQFKSSALSSQK